jgi:hypothetical protein
MPTAAHNPLTESTMLLWVEDRGGGPDIYAKRMFNNGLPQGGPDRGGWQVVRDDSAFNRNSEPPGPREDPRLVYNSQREEFLLVYSEDAGGLDGWDVYAVRVNSAGFSTGRPRLIAGGPADQRHPDVAVIADGEYHIVWDDNARDIDEIHGQRLQANAIPKGGPSVLLRQATNATDPTVSPGLLAWVDDVNGNADIYGLRIENTKPIGTPYRLGGDQTLDDTNPRFSGSGLVWNVFDPGTGFDILGVTVYGNGRERGGARGILVPAADQGWPDAANGVVVFADNRSGGFDIYGVRVAGNDLRTRGGEFPLVLDNPLP